MVLAHGVGVVGFRQVLCTVCLSSHPSENVGKPNVDGAKVTHPLCR